MSPEPTDTALGTPWIGRIEIDRMAEQLTLHRTDGTVVTLAAPSWAMTPGSQIRKINYLPVARLAHFETRRADQIVVELPSGNAVAPVNGRPVIYLDQNHWSTLTKTIHAPSRVTPHERTAAERLIELALAREVILPLSSGHAIETGQWTNNDQRYRLATTMLQLSFGWQMRDPLDVRRRELANVYRRRFRSEVCPAVSVFTLLPWVASRERRMPDPSPTLPDASFAEHQMLTAVAANVETMLDPEPTERVTRPRWPSALQDYTDWLSSEPPDSHWRRQRTNLLFLRADLHDELAEEAIRVGLTVEEMDEWITDHLVEDVPTMPFLGIYREIQHQRTIDGGTRWQTSDLIDQTYVGCAAGYANFVVTERALTGVLRQSLTRLGRPMNVYRRLQDLMRTFDEQ